MTPEQFCYWFQGFIELGGHTMPTPEQWKSICEHAQTVFKKVTPPLKADDSLLEALKKAVDEKEKKRDRDTKKDWPKYEWPGVVPMDDRTRVIC